MAKGEVADFLKAYYRRLHTDAMDYDVLARLVDNKKKGLLTKEQEEWFNPDKGFIIADNNPLTNPYPELGYRAKDLPALDGSDGELTEPELVKLYERFAKAMAKMKSASVDYGANDGDAKRFVELYVDEVKLFPTPKATKECEESIQALVERLDENGKTSTEQEIIKNIKQVILDETRKVDKPDEKLFNSTEDINKLLQKCRDGKHNTDTSVQNKIQQVARTLDNYLNSWSYDNDAVSSAKQKNKEFLGSLSDALSIIPREGAFTEIAIDENKLKDFKEVYGQQMLYELYYNKSIRDKFGVQDPRFVETITKAEGKISYQDPESKDYVEPKSEDTFTPLQQVEKWATDTYKNSIRKYMRLRGDPLLFSGFSKEIFKAIDKKDVKPTDGLNGLLDKAKDIKEKISNKTVMEHFDWFVETMNKIKDKKPKAVAGAWNNAKQMKTVITEIILKATGPNAKDEDMEKAKTAMEIMTAMKYGMMTSKIMEAMHATDFNIFSDGELSWNKNEGIQVVTRAFDKSIKFAFEALGLGLTFARNKIMMSGIKFNDKDNENVALAKNIAYEKNQLSKRHGRDMHAIDDIIKNKEQEKDENTNILKTLKNKYKIDADNIDDKTQKAADYKAKMESYKQKMDKHLKRSETYKSAYDEYKRNEAIVDEYKNLSTVDIPILKADIESKKDDIKRKREEILANDTYTDPLTGMPLGAEERRIKETQLLNELNQLQSDYNDLERELNEKNSKNTPEYFIDTVIPAKNNMTRLQTKKSYYENAQKDYESAKKHHDFYETHYNSLNDKVQQYTDATKALQEAIDTIDAQKTARTTWPTKNVNKVKELEDFWNFLQTGKARTWRPSTEKKQKKFDTEKEQMYADWVAQYGMDM